MANKPAKIETPAIQAMLDREYPNDKQAEAQAIFVEKVVKAYMEQFEIKQMKKDLEFLVNQFRDDNGNPDSKFLRKMNDRLTNVERQANNISNVLNITEDP